MELSTPPLGRISPTEAENGHEDPRKASRDRMFLSVFFYYFFLVFFPDRPAKDFQTLLFCARIVAAQKNIKHQMTILSSATKRQLFNNFTVMEGCG